MPALEKARSASAQDLPHPFRDECRPYAAFITTGYRTLGPLGIRIE